MAFKVDIINIENNVNNILLTDDLTIELLKVRYNWILNATIRNAVLGLDDYGLVWYMGEWICGEWEDGTWYSGIWHDGIWKNGRWYSYLLDKNMILTQRFVVLEEDKIYSQFLNGKWYVGEWHNGIFGNDSNVSGMTTSQVTSEVLPCPYWYNGNFYNGLFKNSVWHNGIFYGGLFLNSYWMTGKFYNGSFDNYEWWSGNFYGGDFVKGIWSGGTFNQIKTDILSRFGTDSGVTSAFLPPTLSFWENGTFENGQFMSGLNIDSSGNTIASACHNITHWKDGTFNNGIWYGGHFEKGNFNYGKWYGGIFNTDISDAYTSLTIWKNGYWYDGLWMNGIFKSGMFFCGMWLNGIFENGFLISEYQGTFTQDLILNTIPHQLPPSPPPTSYTLPTVELINVDNIMYNSCTVHCNVIGDGGLPTTRGICYSDWQFTPTKNDHVIYDSGTGIGNYAVPMTNLSQATGYIIRAFATNSLGTSYSPLPATFVVTPVQPIPEVTTGSATPVSNTSTLTGTITNIGGSPVTQYGFIYSDVNPPYSGTYSITSGNITTVPLNYSTIISGLNWYTTYYYVAYANNSYGIGFGDIKTFDTVAGEPSVSTTTPTSVSSTGATCGGDVISDNGSSVIVRGVCWSKTHSSPTLVDSHTSDGSGTGIFVSILTGLTPNTYYYVRAYATNGIGTSYAPVDSFYASNGLPIVTTTTITSITNTGATSGGHVTYDGGSTVTSRGVCWSTTQNPTISNSKTSDGTGVGIYVSYLTSLSAGTLYYVRSYATNSVGTSYGNQLNFTTTTSPATVTTTAITNITSTSATSGGNVSSDGGSTVTARGVCWSTSINPTISNSHTNNGSGTGSFTSNITGLSPFTTYYVRAYATNSNGTSYGSQLSFITIASATVTTTAITSITQTTATSGGNVTSDGGSSVTARGVCWSTSVNPTTADSKTTDGTGTGVFISSITGLVAGTIYHVRAYVTNSVGTSYGSDISFTTNSVPIITTSSISNITYNSASSGGNVTSDGGSPPVTARGVCWSTSANPTTANPHTTDGTGTGTFTSSLTGLLYGHTYYVRAYATNSIGTGYGNSQTFTTLTIPTVTTTVPVEVYETSAVAGGNVTASGGYNVTARGVCWNTGGNPTISNSHTTDGSGLGVFTSNVTGLSYNTTYYLKAYATNSVGTSYGSQTSFTTPPHP